jgi:hypothetical protein
MMLATMMLADFNIELVQQPRNSLMLNVLDLAIWRTTQVLVDRTSTEARGREPGLVKTAKKAWTQLPGMKILEAFEWRRDAAQEALDTEGCCPMERKGKGGSKVAFQDSAGAALHTYFVCVFSNYGSLHSAVQHTRPSMYPKDPGTSRFP